MKRMECTERYKRTMEFTICCSFAGSVVHRNPSSDKINNLIQQLTRKKKIKRQQQENRSSYPESPSVNSQNKFLHFQVRSSMKSSKRKELNGIFFYFIDPPVEQPEKCNRLFNRKKKKLFGKKNQ